jgi:malonyl-CoA O-methyltransferase
MNEIDEYSLDKARVRRAFGRAAASYDAAAVLQREVLERMFERLDVVTLKPQHILDAGCGTGSGSRRLAARYRNSQVLSLDFSLPMLQAAQLKLSWVQRWLGKRRSFACGDIEALPVTAGKMDLIWSNLALQWCNDLDAAFSEMHRVLRPEGLFMFSTFGPDTLMELRQATNNSHTHVSRFIDMHDIGDALVRAGFSAPVMDVERFTLTYDDVLSVMRDLKAIGANNATAGRPRGLEGRAFLNRLTANYEPFRKADGKLPATFEVVYGHAWKPQPNLPDGLQPVIFKPRR